MSIFSFLPDWPLPLKLALLSLPMVFNWWGIWHAQRSVFASPVTRILWLYACIFLPVVGGLAYLFFGRPKARRAA